MPSGYIAESLFSGTTHEGLGSWAQCLQPKHGWTGRWVGGWMGADELECKGMGNPGEGYPHPLYCLPPSLEFKIISEHPVTSGNRDSTHGKEIHTLELGASSIGTRSSRCGSLTGGRPSSEAGSLVPFPSFVPSCPQELSACPRRPSGGASPCLPALLPLSPSATHDHLHFFQKRDYWSSWVRESSLADFTKSREQLY